MKNKRLSSLIYILSVIPLLVMEFLYHRATPFMMDDLWYSTNLKTGQALSAISDIFIGQIWHYLNWGGRSITHTVLQFILMGGELFADIMNVLVTILLAYISTLYIRKEYKPFAFALFLNLIITLNPNIQYSMFWQSGSVNYLYSSVWILLFMYFYIRELKDDAKRIPAINIFIVPLGLITGWSNENMGPAAFCLSLMCILTLLKNKKRPETWMYLGSVFSLIGSALCILAPGNFVRSEFANEESFIELLQNRVLSMMTGACAFLLPSIILLFILIIIYVRVCNQKLASWEIILIITAFLAYMAMILSPHFPDRAAFGIMTLNIIVSISVVTKIFDYHKDFLKYINLLYLGASIFNILLLVTRVF